MRAIPRLALVFSLSLPAGAAAATPLAPEGLAATAIAESPVIRAMDHAIAAAKSRSVASGAPNNPSLVGQAQLSPQVGNNLFTLGFRQPLDFRGLAAQRRDQAAEEVEILTLQRERLKLDVGMKAKEAYWQTWIARVELQRHERDLAWQRSELERARKRVELGAASRHELVDAELDLLEAELAERHARQQAAGQLARLNFLLGRSESAPLDLAAPGSQAGKLEPLSVWLADAERLRPEPHQIAIARRREERGIRLAESLRFGEGEIEAQAGTAANSDPLFYGTFSLPIPLWNRHEGERAMAAADAARLDAERVAVKQAIAQEVLTAYYTALEAQARLLDVSERLLPHAEHVREKAETRLKLGAGTHAEWQSARHVFSKAESEIAKARLDYQLSLLRLAAAAGR
jgi:outer membrane protein TolC